MRIAAVTALVAAALSMVGAISPWFSFSLLGVTARIHGTDPGLHGHVALGLGIAAAIVATGVLLAGDRRTAGIAGLAVVGIVGLVGLAVMRSQAHYLNTNAQARVGRAGLGLFKTYLGQRTTTAWGYWLDVGAFAGLVVVPAVAWLSVRAYNRRIAPPSTGIAQPVRYDAAGDSANAAT